MSERIPLSPTPGTEIPKRISLLPPTPPTEKSTKRIPTERMPTGTFTSVDSKLEELKSRNDRHIHYMNSKLEKLKLRVDKLEPLIIAYNKSIKGRAINSEMMYLGGRVFTKKVSLKRKKQRRTKRSPHDEQADVTRKRKWKKTGTSFHR